MTELPDSITTESYTLVVSLLDKWNKSENKDAYAEEKEILEKKKAEIEAIQEEIDAINQEVIDKLYPVDRISLKEKETVKSIVARCKKLSEYDQKQIQQYEDIQRAETMIRNRTTAVWLGAVLGILAVILIIFVVLHMKKKRGGLGGLSIEERLACIGLCDSNCGSPSIRHEVPVCRGLLPDTHRRHQRGFRDSDTQYSV